MGGHGASLQSLLAGSNPQLIEQLLSSGALSPLPPGMFEGVRCVCTMPAIYVQKRCGKEFSVGICLFVCLVAVAVEVAGLLAAPVLGWEEVRVGGEELVPVSKRLPDLRNSSSLLG